MHQTPFASPSTCPTIMRPSSPATAALAFLSLEYWTKAQPLCTEQPTTLPYLEKMASTSALVTSSVLRLPMKTRELRERGSVLLVTLLLAIRLEVDDDDQLRRAEMEREKKQSRAQGKCLETLQIISAPHCGFEPYECGLNLHVDFTTPHKKKPKLQ